VKKERWRDTGMMFEYIDKLNVPFEIFNAGENNSFPAPPHWHFYMELIFMTKGRMRAVCDDKSYLLSEGDLLICYPQVIHSFLSAGDERPAYDVLKFDLQTAHGSNRQFLEVNAFFLAAGKDKDAPVFFSGKDLAAYDLRPLFESCIREQEEKNYGYSLIVHSRICILLALLARAQKALGYVPKENVSRDMTSLQAISQYIDEHSAEHITVQELADVCHLSYTYFSRIFKKYYGKSCRDYIENIRISKSEYLLLYTDHDLNTISSETGFSDCSHFIKTFRKYKRTTPNQYRLHPELY